MRNPKWHRDELILALDLYFKLKPGQIYAGNPEIIKLSEILNNLPIHSNKPDEQRFRNANGVSMKLSNFLAIDPSYKGKGMSAFAKLDKEIFDEFLKDKALLAKLAEGIKTITIDEKLKDVLSNLNETPEEAYSAKEGEVLYKLHKLRERNQTLIKKKKDKYYKKHGNLACELCGFDFEKRYGEVGKGFIECHHRTPLAELSINKVTTLDDLLLVCANCHRMLHRRLS